MNNEELGKEKGEESIISKVESPVPEMTGQDGKREFKLPIGSIDLSNALYKTVKLGVLDGTVRKKIGRPEVLSNPGRIATAALESLIDFSHFKFNDVKQETKLMVRSMYSGDRSACLLKIRELTRRQAPIIQRLDCPHCGAVLEISTSPGEIKTIPVGETDYKIEGNEWLLSIKTEAGNLVRLGLARGFDEEALTREQIQNINESAYVIIAAVCKDFDGRIVDVDFFEKLDVGVFDEILAGFIENQPGPDTRQSIKCTACDRDFDFAVDPSDFLLPSAGLKRSARRGKKSEQ